MVAENDDSKTSARIISTNLPGQKKDKPLSRYFPQDGGGCGGRDDLYDQLSLLKSMEMILEIDPLNMNDGLAAPMFSLFTETPDNHPYRLPEPSKHLTPQDKALYRYLL